MRLATASRRFPGADNYEMAAGAFGVGALNNAPAVYPDAPVSDLPGLDDHWGPSGQLRGHTWTGGKRRSYSE
jgi:hypothetical protein